MHFYSTLKEFNYLANWTYQIVALSIRCAELPPPEECFCFVCGNEAEEYHHVDYRRPLEVFPVCHLCHMRWHASLDKELYPRPSFQETVSMYLEQPETIADARTLISRTKDNKLRSRRYMIETQGWSQRRWNRARKAMGELLAKESDETRTDINAEYYNSYDAEADARVLMARKRAGQKHSRRYMYRHEGWTQRRWNAASEAVNKLLE